MHSVVGENANQAIENTYKFNDTPSKSLLRSSSIKYSNDADIEPNLSYTETSSYIEQPVNVEQPGKAHYTNDKIKIQHQNSIIFIPTVPHFILTFGENLLLNFLRSKL